MTRRREPRPKQPNAIANLASFVPAPTHKNAVLAVLRAAEKPLLLREIKVRASLPVTDAHRVMDRLAKAGVVSRFKVLMSEPHAALMAVPIHRGKSLQKRRPMFLYSIVEDDSQQ